VKNHARAFKPPAKRIQNTDTRSQQRNSKQQHADVAEINHDGGKKITLRRDVALLRLQNVKRQRQMKRIRRADEQMEKNEIVSPVENQIPQRKNQNDDHGVDRKKIWRERDDKIRFGNDDVAAGRTDFHFFYLSAKQPSPKRVREFVAENVKPHRLGQQQKNHEPTRRTADKRNPRRVRATARAQHEPQRPCRARANGQQQNRDNKFDPLRHGERIQNSEFRSQQKALSKYWWGERPREPR
jgi:hypothetical protein